MLKSVVAAVALLVAGTCAATAADIPYKAPAARSPAYVQGVNWTGWFGGVSIGYATSETSEFQDAFGAQQLQLKPDGFMFMLQGGYDYQIPNSNWVVGAEVQIPLITIDDTVADPSFVGASYKGTNNWAVLITGKVGYAYGNWLPYVGAGVGFVDATASGVVPGFATVEDSHTHTGLLLTTGLRYMINPSWWVGFQYMHGEFAAEKYAIYPPGTPFDDRSVSFSTDTFMFQASYRPWH